MNSERIDKIVIIATFFLMSGSLALTRPFTADIIILPLYTISLSFALFLIYLLALKFSPESSIDLPQSSLLNSVIFIMIAISSVIGKTSTSGVSDWYYILIIITVSLLAFRIASPHMEVSIQLFQILLIGLVVRATPWYSYPVYGQDRFHQTAVGYLVSTGNIVPEAITYYANFPSAHVLAAGYTLITGAIPKVGYFSLGIVVAISLSAVYLLGREILNDVRSALFATLFVAVASYHIKSGAEPFAQALFTGMVPFVFYLAFSQNRSYRRTGILFLLSIFAATVQNIGPLVLFGTCIAALTVTWCFKYIQPIFSTKSLIADFYPTILLTSVIGIVGVYYYIIADYFRFQTMRIVWLVDSITTQSPGGQQTIEDTGVSGVPAIELFGQDLPGVLMWAAPLLTIGGALVLTYLLLIYSIIQDDSELGHIEYISMATAIFLIFAIAFISGGPAARAIPSVIILISPVIGWTLSQFIRNQPTMGRVVTVLIIFCTVSSGVLTPPVAKAELGNDNFRAWMSSDQTTAADFAIKYTDEAQTSFYIASYETYRSGSRGDLLTETILLGNLTKDDPKTVTKFQNKSQNGTTTLYFRYFGTAYGLNEPDTNKIYTTGNSSIYT